MVAQYRASIAGFVGRIEDEGARLGAVDGNLAKRRHKNRFGEGKAKTDRTIRGVPVLLLVRRRAGCSFLHGLAKHQIERRLRIIRDP